MLLATFHRLLRRLAYALADVAADAVYALWTPGRRRIRENLRVVLGTDDVATLDYWGQRQLRRYGEYCLEALWPAGPTPADCDAALEADPADWERVRALAARGAADLRAAAPGQLGRGRGGVHAQRGAVDGAGGVAGGALARRRGAGAARAAGHARGLRDGAAGGAAGAAIGRRAGAAVRPAAGDGGAGRRCDVLRRALPAAGGAGAAGPGDGRPRRADGGAADRQPGAALPRADRARLRPAAQRRPRGRRANADAVAAGLVRGAGATASRPVVHVPPLLLD